MTKQEKQREQQFTLRQGESWFRGARVRKAPAAKLVNPRQRRRK